MVRHDEHRGTRADAGVMHGLQDRGNLRVEEGHRGHGGRRPGSVAVLRRIQVEQVEQHQVGAVLPDDVRRRHRPDPIPPEDVLRGEAFEIGLREDAGLDGLLRDPSLGIGAFRELPGDRRRVEDRHPVDLRGGQAFLVRRVIERAAVHRAPACRATAPRPAPRPACG